MELAVPNSLLLVTDFPSRRLPFDPKSCGICGGQSATGAGFLRVLRFPLSLLITHNARYLSVIRGWYNNPSSGRRTKSTFLPSYKKKAPRK
jgi:hypothetical protein